MGPGRISVSGRGVIYGIFAVALAILAATSLLAYRHFFERGVTFGETALRSTLYTDAPAIGANTFLHLESDPEKVRRELATQMYGFIIVFVKSTSYDKES